MLINYIKTALRNIRRSPIFYFINIVGLGIGLTAFFYIFFWIAEEVNYDRCFKNKDNIYMALGHEVYSNGDELYFSPSQPELGPALIQNFPEFENYARYKGIGTSVLTIGEKTLNENLVHACDKSFFEIFDFEFLYGNKSNVFTDKQSVVITEKYARKLFGNENPIGKTFSINTEYQYTVGNVIKEPRTKTHLRLGILISFENLKDMDDCYEGWSSYCLETYLLLKDGIDPSTVNPKIKHFIDDYEEGNIVTISLYPLLKIRLFSEHILSNFQHGSIMQVYVFSAIAILILAIAFINYINLNTTEQLRRIKEIGIRKTLGGNKYHIRKQFIVESLFYSFFAIDIAIILFEIFRDSLNQLSGKQITIRYSDWNYILLMISTFVIISLLSSAFPIFIQSRYKISLAIKGRTSSNRGQNRLRKSLIIFQFIITFLLILGSIVLKKQLNYISSIDLGFEKEDLYYIHLKGSQRTKVPLYREELLKINGIKSVSGCSDIPGDISSSIIADYWDGNTGDETFQCKISYVDEYFVETIGLNILQGSNFVSSSENNDDTLSYSLINEAVCKIINNDNPVLTRFAYDDNLVKGVIKDYHFESLHSKIFPLLMFHSDNNFFFLLIKVESNNKEQILANLRKVWKDINPDFINSIQSLERRLNHNYLADKKIHSLIITFSFLAVFIACMGLYGLSIHTSQKRTKEIGIRKAIGASVPQLINLLSSDFLRLILIAVIIAIPGGYFMVKKILSLYAYQIDVTIHLYLLAVILTLGIAFLTIIYQVYKSARTNPVDNLRYE